MKLRIRCSIYSDNSPQRSASNCGGAPKFLLSKNIFANFIEYGFTIKEMSALLGISERTVYRRMSKFNFKKINFSDVDENQLDHEIIQITEEFPYCGELMIREILRQMGFHVQSTEFVRVFTGYAKVMWQPEKKEDFIGVFIMSKVQIICGILTPTTNLWVGISS